MLLAFVLSFVVLDADPLSEAAKEELKLLQGEWKLVRAEKDGKSREAKDDEPTLVVVIQGDKWLLRTTRPNDTGPVDKARIVMIDQKTMPKCLNTKSLEKGFEGTVTESIYKLEGDTLTICSHQGAYLGKKPQRPTEFKTSDADTVLMVLKRLKP